MKDCAVVRHALERDEQLGDRLYPQVGTVPDGYHLTVDDLHGAAIGQEFWVRWTDADQESSSVPFKLSKIKDGSVMDSSGNVISRADFDKRYHC